MKTTIYVPNKINVGFQNRSDTYTKKLAYVIYYDEKGKLRKEASWQSWRDNKIPNEEFDNIPTEGFVLNKKVGDYNSGWNHRQAYCRIYDPRNFEFEITIENLLYILENTNSIKGKGLEGEFVYGWDGKDLILIPVSSPDYLEIKKYSNILNNNETIKAKDLILGATYATKDNEQWIYMGKFDCYDYQYRTYENGEYKWYKKYKDIPRIQKERSNYWGSHYYEDTMDYQCKQINCGKEFFFLRKYKNWNNENYEVFEHVKSISKKFIIVVNDKCIDNYAELFDRMEFYEYYSPIDDTKDKLVDFTLEDFKQLGMKYYTDDSPHYTSFKFISLINGTNESYLADPKRNENNYQVKQYIKKEQDRFTYGYSVGFESTDIFENGATLEEIYNVMKPQYIQKYLENGREYKKEYSYEK